MPKRSPKKPQKILLFPSPPKKFCSECHREIKYVVEAVGFTYVVHDIDDVCAIDNLGAKHG